MPNPVSTGLPHPAAYDTSTFNVVVDEVTGLTWRLSVGVTGSLANDEAYCASAGFRLPSLIELATIVDPTRAYPAANSTAFPGLISPFHTSDMDWFRTSTWATGYSDIYGSLPPDSAMWYVNFATGEVELWGVSGNGTGAMDNILCVSGPTGSAFGPDCQYQVQDDGMPTGTVLDTRTGLTWQQLVTGTQYAPAAAGAYCANDTPGLPGSGWRLPSYNELLTIVDYGAALPALDTTAFPSMPLNSMMTLPFITSSKYPGSAWDQSGTWIVDFALGGGYVVQSTASPKGHVRCVR